MQEIRLSDISKQEAYELDKRLAHCAVVAIQEAIQAKIADLAHKSTSEADAGAYCYYEEISNAGINTLVSSYIESLFVPKDEEEHIEHVRSRLLFELNKHIPSNDHERQEVLIPIMAYALIVSNEYNWDTVKRRIQSDKIRIGPHKRNVYPYNHWKHVDPYSIKRNETPPKSDTFNRCISALKDEINVVPYTALCDIYYITYAYTLLKNYDFLVRCEDIAKIGLFLRRILTDSHNGNTPMNSLIRLYIANHLDNILLRSYALCDANYTEALFSKASSNHLLSYYISNNEHTPMYLIDTCASVSDQDSRSPSLSLQFEENYDSWTFSTIYHSLIENYAISDEDLNLLLDFYLDSDILSKYAHLVGNTKTLTKNIINYSNKGHVIPDDAISDAMVDLALWLFKRRKVHLVLHIKYSYKGKWHGIPRVRRAYISKME